jgi:hypothetical protein
MITEQMTEVVLILTEEEQMELKWLLAQSLVETMGERRRSEGSPHHEKLTRREALQRALAGKVRQAHP